MRQLRTASALAVVAWALSTVTAPPAGAQITDNLGDGVLNAPYRGTIDSLRECTMDIGYGEVMTHLEPRVGLPITSAQVAIWVDEDWDRSVLRMYEGLDASGSEIDLTGTSSGSPATVYTDADDMKRLSFKAIGTKTLAVQPFTVHFRYQLSSGQSEPSSTIRVAPITGTFCDLPGEREAFLLGTPVLDVAVGNARLTVPIGRTAEMIGQAFEYKDDNLAGTGIDRFDVVLPGAAESVFLQNNDQFRLGSTYAAKTAYGTPWPGYLLGYWVVSSEPRGPDGTMFDSTASSSAELRPFDYIRPLDLSEKHDATQTYEYTSGLVTEISDGLGNAITLERTAGVVTRIETSDGRGWDIESDTTDGWITAIKPDGGKGARYFSYDQDAVEIPRVTQVRDANEDVMYEFRYELDENDIPAELTAERHFIDDLLRSVVTHEVVSESLRSRGESAGPGQTRVYEFAYDTGATPNPLNHRLASITSYSEFSGEGDAYTTTFTHDVDNPDGSMVIDQVELPDGSTITYEYDSHIGPQSVDFGLRTKATRTGLDGSLVTFDVDYEFLFWYSGSNRLFSSPRIVHRRDGRGALSEVVFDYEQEAGASGSLLNRLLSRTGPTIDDGYSGTRVPETLYTYSAQDEVLTQTETAYASGQYRVVTFDYDDLLRLTSRTVDPGGEELVTHYLYCDGDATQNRITVDPDGYWTRRQHDNDGRVIVTERFLNADPGSLATPCADPTGPVYTTTNSYDDNGWLATQMVENKDQDGVSLTPATITTTFAYDRIGRLSSRTLDLGGGVEQVSYFGYSRVDDVLREYDTSGRGIRHYFDSRGLVECEMPLGRGAQAVKELATTFEYDAMGNLRFVNRPTGATPARPSPPPTNTTRPAA